MMFRAKVYLRRNLRPGSRAGNSQFEANVEHIYDYGRETDPHRWRIVGDFHPMPGAFGRIFNELGEQSWGTTFYGNGNHDR